MSAGSPPAPSTPLAKYSRRATSTRIGCRTGTADDADAAEIVVRCRPAPNGAAAGFEFVERRGVDAGLGMNDAWGGMEPRPFNGGGS
jgi:hypothetical protein